MEETVGGGVVVVVVVVVIVFVVGVVVAVVGVPRVWLISIKVMPEVSWKGIEFKNLPNQHEWFRVFVVIYSG